MSCSVTDECLSCFFLFLPLTPQQMSTLFLGRRSRTKSDLSMKMYEEEIQVCGLELEIPASVCGEQNVAYNNKPSF